MSVVLGLCPGATYLEEVLALADSDPQLFVRPPSSPRHRPSVANECTCEFTFDEAVRDLRRTPLASGAVSPILPTAQNATAVSPTHEIFNRLLRERIIFLGTEVDDDLANVVCAQLLHLAGEDADQDVWLYINSPGGSVTAGMAIYDTMHFIEPDVATVCMGLGASMGQFLLCAGAKGKRYALPHARIMMHQPSGGFRGQAADIAIQAEQLLYVKQLMAERIAYHTGQTVDQVLADSERDRWFTAEQAKDYGVIDNVIVKRGEML
jgi:ATP-dependent Clp protease protease subunit